MDYRERVEALINKYLLVKGNQILTEMKEYASVKAMLENLKGEQAEMMSSNQFPAITRFMKRLNIDDDFISAYHLELLERERDSET